MQIFYVNIGGGEPTIRSDFWELVEYARPTTSASSSRPTDPASPRRSRPAGRQRLRRRPDLPGRGLGTGNDAVRGAGSFATARSAMERLAAAGFAGFKLSVVVTRHNVGELDDFRASPTGSGPTPAHPAAASGRGAAGTSSTRPPPSSASSTTGCRPRRGAHRRLLLPPGRLGRAFRTEPLRRRAGGVPGRPGG